MVIREAGLIFRGFTLVSASYHETNEGEIDTDLRSGLLTALLNFAESAFSTELVEYFELKRYVIAFTENKIIAEDNSEPEILIAYAILDREKKIGKYLKKIVLPLLKKVAIQFIADYNRKNLSEISQFLIFKDYLDNIFGSDTKNIEEKLQGLFY
ncbi:MAG: hypothetical protein ACTSRI_19425 [Promethearchaeota archaeon]